MFNEGDPVERFYLVRRGSVTLSRHGGQKESAIAYCAAGSIVDSVGETSGTIFTLGHRPCDGGHRGSEPRPRDVRRRIAR